MKRYFLFGKRFDCLLHHILRREAEGFKQFDRRAGRAEGIERYDRALASGILVPAKRRTRFNNNAPINCIGQHALSVFFALLLENLDTRHRDHAGADALILQHLRVGNDDVRLLLIVVGI